MSPPPVPPVSLKIPVKTCEAIVHSQGKVLKATTMQSVPTTDSVIYTFAIFLPAGIPPTMECVDRETRGNCAVKYTLTASALLSVLQGDSVTDTTVRMQTVETNCGLHVIGEPLSSHTYPFSVRPTCFHVKQNLFRHGHITVTARTENTHVSKDGSLCLTLASVNKSQHDIDRVEVSLIETVKWSISVSDTNKVSKHWGRLKTDCKIVLRSYTNWFPFGLLADSIPSSSFGSAGSMPSQQELSKVDELMHKERNQTTVHVPPMARTSYKEQLIHVSHCIQVTLAVLGIYPPQYPKLCIPVFVFDPPIQSTTRNNHHTTLGVVNISMNLDEATLHISVLAVDETIIIATYRHRSYKLN
jgi:hypothetical protein